MRRRDVILCLGGAAAAWPLGARSQQGDRLKRIGVLIGLSSENSNVRSWVTAFIEELARLGWIDGGNVRVEQRWTNADTMRANSFAKELVALQTDIILTESTPATAALHRETTTIPIVFTVVSDPVGAGFVASMRRPGGNITGFTHTDAALGGKWLDLLKEIAPGIKRAAIMFNPDTAPGGGDFFLGSFEAAARSLALEPLILPVRSVAEIETAVSTLGSGQAGLVLMDDSFMGTHSPRVIELTGTNNVPAIFVEVSFVRAGGLISYGPDFRDIFRRAAGYANRILRGEKPADLPVQIPTKFETGVNLKTAKALGLTVPPRLLATADEVIE
jgi:putative tryptophan/tyrosine transport system substrate-binding protein